METRSEPVTKSWRSDRCENPQERRDTEAEKMKQAGWTVEPYSAEITGRQGFTVYGFEARRPADVPQKS